MTPEALRELELAAMKCMDEGSYSDALVLWETRLRSGESGLAPFPLYALCLGEVGRVKEALALCERTRDAIATLEPGERRDQLQQLLNQVIGQLPGSASRQAAPLPSPEPDSLFGGDSSDEE